MCGIGGILRTDGQSIPEEWLDAIDARIAWRGPDGAGRFRDRVEFTDEQGERRVVEVAFVHRRLSIIDHATGGQPMVSERGRDEREGLVAVVFNGCIYNHRELRKELESKGHRFVTDHSDTEVLIHGWREWNASLAAHLEGMYAYAIWDHVQARLSMARDEFGEKPLYQRTWPADYDAEAAAPIMLAFASALPALLNIDGCWDCAPDVQWIASVLRRGYVSAVANSQPSVYVLNAGHTCTQRPPRPAGVFDCRATAAYGNNRAIPVSNIEALLDRAVAQRLEADVPLGCFLSGGVDSSLIAYFANKHAAGLHTFAVRMLEPRYDESGHAARVAAHLGTKHQTLDVDPQPAQDLVQLIGVLGQPFGDSSILPTYWVSRAARQFVKVALSGDGGDEAFLGYERHVAARFLGRNYRWLRHLPVRPLHRFHPKSYLHKLARLANMATDLPAVGISAMAQLFSCAELRSMLDVPELPIPQDSPRPDGNRFDGLAALQVFDVCTNLPDDLLRKVDTASMACGLEVRCPFLDRDLARAALSMPIDQLMPRGQRKGLLRQIARKYLPREIVDRPKMGFAIPIGEWFRTDYGQMKTLLLDHLNSVEPFGPILLNRKAVQRFIDEHMSGKRDHGQRLFTLLTLSIWANQTSKSQNVKTSK